MLVGSHLVGVTTFHRVSIQPHAERPGEGTLDHGFQDLRVLLEGGRERKFGISVTGAAIKTEEVQRLLDRGPVVKIQPMSIVGTAQRSRTICYGDQHETNLSAGKLHYD